ncbi:MAG: hypothetical protein ACRDQD_26360, partial [Nocardioidaceae bacterium]
MQTRTLARAATLLLAAGGLMVIPASPAASVDCDVYTHNDYYDNQGIRFWSVPVRHGSYTVCPIVADNIFDDSPDIHCAKQVDGTKDDWIFFANHSPEDPWDWGWIRESKLDVHDGDRWVHRCFDDSGGPVHITQE